MIKTSFYSKSQKGASLLIVVIIVSLVLIIVMAVSMLMVTEFKMAGNLEDSQTAYYAAMAGMEDGLLQYKADNSIIISPGINVTLENDASYNLTITEQPTGSGKRRIQSIGSQNGVIRKIEREALKP